MDPSRRPTNKWTAQFPGGHWGRSERRQLKHGEANRVEAGTGSRGSRCADQAHWLLAGTPLGQSRRRGTAPRVSVGRFGKVKQFVWKTRGRTPGDGLLSR